MEAGRSLGLTYLQTMRHVIMPQAIRIVIPPLGNETINLVLNSSLASAIGYGELLAAFWECHDPTQLNRQGPDSGTQYRSAIFCHGEEQLSAASASLAAAQPRFGGGIVTLVEPAQEFWRAEDYHQKYFLNKSSISCGSISSEND